MSYIIAGAVLMTCDDGRFVFGLVLFVIGSIKGAIDIWDAAG